MQVKVNSIRVQFKSKIQIFVKLTQVQVFYN